LICKSCSGEGVKIVDKKSKPSDHSSCVAESLIRNKNNPMGVMSYEDACKLCSCLANKHEGELEPNTSKQFIKVTEEYKRQNEVEQEAKTNRVFYEDTKKHEAVEYYQKRITELKELDKNGPEWILEEEAIKDDN